MKANLSTVDLKETGAGKEVRLFEPRIKQLEDITGYTTLTTLSQHHYHLNTTCTLMVVSSIVSLYFNSNGTILEYSVFNNNTT